ncbi:ABC transporter substrate-binding protein [Dickeya solani]|uniref:ABC transporter substrate-binding protein n=2 Tax=Dickeya solani TaxID=1089444 RepID=A0ABU4EIH2_9GAMM|nr:ABC transporter substrate-binding protein [Dickeya solani]MCA7000139.1 ABC transporter substrate-binding protein [Dickeya solani]MCZ0823556.1 ABC transporter substrate-binding protein [Dickeya solani]MDV6994327.1 ABC transporter substrate-binding protein [Dickeya solani]MDV7005727.1 ABC transporter substrate-binding protein [Dickeya solani]MDV7038160.1 ABC transporter substrate-binding protein [Dickeya solani]
MAITVPPVLSWANREKFALPSPLTGDAMTYSVIGRSARCLSSALLACLLAGSALADTAPTRTVHYYGDRTVEVPARIERIAASWNAQNSIIAMLGYGDRIVATTKIVRDTPLFRQFVPSIAQAALASRNGDMGINSEVLVAMRAQVLFMPQSTPLPEADTLGKAGIRVVALDYNSLAAMVERTLITGEILGPDALARARDFAAYYQDNVRRVSDVIQRIPPEQRLKVYHAVGDPLTTSGRPSLNQDWLDLGGAINVAESWFRQAGVSTAPVSLEQIVQAEPDVIITMRASDAAAIRQDPQWQTLRAVRQGRVYANPQGMFWWCRETSEQALQFLWLAKTLYPQQMQHIDMEKETHDFYQRFYGFDLSAEQVDRILHPR